MTALALLLLRVAGAADIYIYEHPDGHVTFTDTPPHEGYTVFLPDDPPPRPEEVDLRRFPGLDRYDDLLHRAARAHGVPFALLKAVCLAESGMNPMAVSRAGARGLMQLMPATARSLGVTDPHDPAQSIDGGARYLAAQLEAFGSFRLALAAYNAGPAAVRRYGGIPPFPETRTYVERVMALYRSFR